MSNLVAATLTRRIILGLLLGGLVVLSYAVLHLFLVPVAWAVILAYATWPLYARLRLLLRGNATGSALIMTLLLKRTRLEGIHVHRPAGRDIPGLSRR